MRAVLRQITSAKHDAATRGRDTAPSRVVSVQVATSGVVLSVGCVVLLHLFNRGQVSPTRQYVSEYSRASYSVLLVLALFSLAGGLLLIAIPARQNNSPLEFSLFTTIAVLLIIAAIFPTDRTDGVFAERSVGGLLHTVSSVAAVVMLVFGSALLNWKNSANRWLGYLPALASVVTFVLATGFAPDAHGLRQRLILIIVSFWLLAFLRNQAVGSPSARAPSRYHGGGSGAGMSPMLDRDSVGFADQITNR